MPPWPCRSRRALRAVASTRATNLRDAGSGANGSAMYIRFVDDGSTCNRAVGKAGRTVDFFLSRNRDVNAARSFLRSAMKNTRTPAKITLDAYAASHHNLIEQDHRRVKQRIRPMLGFKRFDHEVVTNRRNRVGGEDQEGPIQELASSAGAKVTMSELWNAALAA